MNRGVRGGYQAFSASRIGGKVASVVGASTEAIVIRMQGTKLEYSLREIPATLAVALAERGLDKNDRHTPVVIGAFHLVDREGDSQEARSTVTSLSPPGLWPCPSRTLGTGRRFRVEEEFDAIRSGRGPGRRGPYPP